VAALVIAGPREVRFVRFDEVQDILAGFGDSGPAGRDVRDAGAWEKWIGARDREIRSRIDRGVEDSISNLILYGTSYTSLSRFEDFEGAASASGELTQAAQARVHALVQALPRSGENERVRLVRDFLKQHGISGDSVETYLGTNLRRYISEQRAYDERLKAAAQRDDPGEVFFTRGTLFERRGLSVDTSLLPNYALEDTLRALERKGALPPGGIHRIAIIGPGLDFTDKREGYDFYPLQTVQPFAVMEAAARLESGQGEEPRVVAFDLNPAVLSHFHYFSAQARAGHAYIVQLPRDAKADWKPEAVAYWEHFGEVIGTATHPLPVPPTLQGLMLRAIAVKPQWAERVEARDLDIVTETQDLAPGAGFDLVVATNVLVYYDLFEQALAMASIAHLLNRGGIFLANHALPAVHPQALEYLGRRSVSYSRSGAYGDDVVVYRRR
jgi:hypothetical protein